MQLYQVDNITITILKIIFFLFYFSIAILSIYKKVRIKKQCNIIYLILLILLLGQTIYQTKIEKIIIIGNGIEQKIEKVYFIENNSEYYSYMNYYPVLIQVGKKQYSFLEFENLKKEKRPFLIRHFHLQKRNRIKKIKVNLANTLEPTYIKTIFDTEYYYYGIKDITLYDDNKIYHMKDENYPLGIKYQMVIKDIDNQFHAYYLGEHYHIIECFTKGYSYARAYLIPLTMEVVSLNDFCDEIHNNQ